jgi:hypothetical protein
MGDMRVGIRIPITRIIPIAPIRASQSSINNLTSIGESYPDFTVESNMFANFVYGRDHRLKARKYCLPIIN